MFDVARSDMCITSTTAAGTARLHVHASQRWAFSSQLMLNAKTNLRIVTLLPSQLWLRNAAIIHSLQYNTSQLWWLSRGREERLSEPFCPLLYAIIVRSRKDTQSLQVNRQYLLISFSVLRVFVFLHAFVNYRTSLPLCIFVAFLCIFLGCWLSVPVQSVAWKELTYYVPSGF